MLKKFLAVPRCRQVIDNFGTNQAISVQFGDLVKIYHPQRTDSSSVLYVNESEEELHLWITLCRLMK